ncbi:MAG: hypothetical protein EBZ48_05175 [Proteobacteria bacterium]|nr:hypothetical protein [Pseudomonadota bacterium]
MDGQDPQGRNAHRSMEHVSERITIIAIQQPVVIYSKSLTSFTGTDFCKSLSSPPESQLSLP